MQKIISLSENMNDVRGKKNEIAHNVTLSQSLSAYKRKAKKRMTQFFSIRGSSEIRLMLASDVIRKHGRRTT